MFYDTFIKLCESNGVTPATVAREIGVNPQTISMWKTQGSTPNANTIQKLSDYFGVPISFLLGEKTTSRKPKIQVQTENGTFTISEIETILHRLSGQKRQLDLQEKSLRLELERITELRAETAREEQTMRVLLKMLQRTENGIDMNTVARLAKTFLNKEDE